MNAERLQLSRASSLLVSPPAVVLWLAFAVLSAVLQSRLLCGVFLFLFLFSGTALLWGRRAISRVAVEVACAKTRLYPGMKTTLSYTVRNGKLLPLIWLELSQSIPDRDCLIPDDTFERVEPQESDVTEDETGEPARRAYRRSFSFVMGHETLTLSSVWTAQRRGIYRFEELLLRSGDGFGLSQVEAPCPSGRLPSIVIYPRSVPVDISPFLQNQWRLSTGAAGYQEDMTVLRGLRPYQPNDSWKRINWRMAARQPELKVNFYETVQPQTVLFILDGESFCGLSPEFAELEETLEIIGSAITRLFDRGVCCGLCLPRSRRRRAVALAPAEERSAGELLALLAGYDCLAATEPQEDHAGPPVYLPSRFDLRNTLSAAAEAGQTAVISCAPDQLKRTLLRRLPSERLTVYTAGGGICTDRELRSAPLARLRKEGRL